MRGRVGPDAPVIRRESTTPSDLFYTAISQGGTVITTSIWAMNRIVDDWGQNATDFDPGWWLDDAIEAAESAFLFLAFGQGPPKSIVELYASNQMECVLAALFGSFVFSSVQKRENINFSQTITVKVWQCLSIFMQLVEREAWNCHKNSI
ncbi:hypothetical protein KCU99_g7412, partial [Aureobasidium melanogenum]